MAPTPRGDERSWRRRSKSCGRALRPDGMEIEPDLFRPANFIDDGDQQCPRSRCMLGGVLVIVVLFLFLFDLRTAAISCTAIPLSLLAADHRARAARRDAEHDDAGRPRHRHRRGGRRRRDRRREHRPPAAREQPDRLSRGRSRASCSTPRSKSAAPSFTPPSPSSWCVVPIMTLSGLAGTAVRAVGARLTPWRFWPRSSSP